MDSKSVSKGSFRNVDSINLKQTNREEVVQRNISTILSNGIHLPYLLNEKITTLSSSQSQRVTASQTRSATAAKLSATSVSQSISLPGDVSTNPKNTHQKQQQKSAANESHTLMSNFSMHSVSEYLYHCHPQHQSSLPHLALNTCSNANNNTNVHVQTVPVALNPDDTHKNITVMHPHKSQFHTIPSIPLQEIDSHKKRSVSIPDEFPVINNDNCGKIIQMQRKDAEPNRNSADNEVANSDTNAMNLDVDGAAEEEQEKDEESAEEELVKQDPEDGELSVNDTQLIPQREQKIIDFLTEKWDNYPVTSSDGEPQQKYCPLPPGLHDKHGKPLLLNQNIKYRYMTDEEGESQHYVTDPPSYTFNGSFEDAKRIGIRENKWIMLNIHDTDLFTAQFANPLIWKHKRYGLLIKRSFVLFNCVKANSIRFVQLYNIKNVPSIAIIDPYNNVKTHEFVSPSTSPNILRLRSDILELLQTYPAPKSDSASNRKPNKPTKPPIPHRHHQSNLDMNVTFSDDPNAMMSCIPNINKRKNKQSVFHLTCSFQVSSAAHIYCNTNDIERDDKNIWDLCYPYTNLKNYAYVLSTRQTFNWDDWMHILQKCRNIIGAIPSEQYIEFLRNRHGKMTLESSGTYNGWWSEQRVAEYVVNEKFGLSFEGGFSSENGRERREFLKLLKLSRRPTFKKMLVIIPSANNEDEMFFHKNSLSITPYSEYDKMDNVTSFQLWLSFISYLSVHMLATSRLFKAGELHNAANATDRHNRHYRHRPYTNFCIKLGSKWRLPLKTLYNDMEPLFNYTETHPHFAEFVELFSYPKIATSATTNKPPPSNHFNVTNKYHQLTTKSSSGVCRGGFEVSLFHKTSKQKRTAFIECYQELKRCLLSTDQDEIIDFPFPLFSSGWFSFNTLSVFATIMEQHLNGTWVSMCSPNSQREFKQIFDSSKNTRRRHLLSTKLFQQKTKHEIYKATHLFLGQYLCAKSKQRLLSFWNENRLYCTDLIIDPMNNCISNSFLHPTEKNGNQQCRSYYRPHPPKTVRINHNRRNYRRKRKQRVKRTRNRMCFD